MRKIPRSLASTYNTARSSRLSISNMNNSLNDDGLIIPSPQDPYCLESSTIVKNFKFARSSASSRVVSKQIIKPFNVSTELNRRNSSFVQQSIPPISFAQTRCNNEINEKKTEKLENMIKYNSILDEFLLSLHSNTLVYCLEEFLLKNIPECSSVYYWEDVTSLQKFYCRKLKKVASHESGIIGYAFNNRPIVYIPVASDHEAYDQDFDGSFLNPHSTLVLFTLSDCGNNVTSVVEIIVGSNEKGMNEESRKLIELLQSKFKAFSKWILQSPSCFHLINDQVLLMDTDQYLLDTALRMKRALHARSFELWFYRHGEQTVKRYVENEQRDININKAGIAGSIIQKAQFLHIYNVKNSSYYNPRVDGNISESLMASPVVNNVDKSTILLVIRGCTTGEVFTNDIEEAFRSVTPTIATAFQNSLKFSNVSKGENNNNLFSLIYGALPIKDQKHDTTTLINKLMGALKVYTRADRAFFWVCSKDGISMSSHYQDGSSAPFKVPIGHGHCGLSAMNGEIINCPDASADERFDKTIDKSTDYNTNSILSVPIIRGDGTVGGVVQLINKIDGLPFSNIDSEVAATTGTFCLCILQNIEYLNFNSYLCNTINNIIGTVSDIPSFEDYDKTLRDTVVVINNAMQSQVTQLLFYDRAQRVIYDCLNPEEIVDQGDQIIHDCMSTRKAFFINNCITTPDGESKIVDSKCAAPIYSHDIGFTGIVVCKNREGGYNDELATFLQGFSHIISIIVALNRSRTDKIVDGRKVDLTHWINHNEIGKSGIPRKILYQAAERRYAISQEFNSIAWEEEEMIRFIFYLFDTNGFIRLLKLTNEKVILFCHGLFSRYSKAPYHRINYAINVTQFMLYMSKKAGLNNMFKSTELFAIFCSCLCGWMGHDGTNNEFNTSIESPYSLLFPKEAILESKSVLCMALLFEDTGILEHMPHEDIKHFWKIVHILITSPGMETTSELTEKMREVMKMATIDLSNSENRYLIMKLLYRASIHGSTCRPFRIARKWHDSKTEESFALGDLEMSRKLAFSSPENNPVLYNRVKTATEELSTETIPLIETLASFIGELKPLITDAKENMSCWMQENQ